MWLLCRPRDLVRRPRWLQGLTTFSESKHLPWQHGLDTILLRSSGTHQIWSSLRSLWSSWPDASLSSFCGTYKVFFCVFGILSPQFLCKINHFLHINSRFQNVPPTHTFQMVLLPNHPSRSNRSMSLPRFVGAFAANPPEVLSKEPVARSLGSSVAATWQLRCCWARSSQWGTSDLYLKLK